MIIIKVENVETALKTVGCICYVYAVSQCITLPNRSIDDSEHLEWAVTELVQITRSEPHVKLDWFWNRLLIELDYIKSLD